MSKIESIHKFCIENKKTLAIAESCTGGYLSSLFTKIPDASKYFLGSVVCYSLYMKEKMLHVSPDTLRIHGPVSREVANEMLLGIMKESKADFGVAITGIAGPTGGTKEKPVGTVFIALGASGKKPHVIQEQFTGNRQEIIQASSSRAIEELADLML